MKKIQLFLIHFAGGSCYSFQFLQPLLKEFDFIPLELPGRGRRFDEELITDFEHAGKDIYNQLVPKLSGAPFVIYGHSMGAYLAFRVAGLLEMAGNPPVHLVVSGNIGPVVSHNKTKGPRYKMPGMEFRKELAAMGGIPAEFITNDEMFNLFEPILRADFEIAERNDLAADAPVHIPLYAMMGDKEERCAEISNWANYTSSLFSHDILEGNHFFIQQHPQRVAEVIRHCCRSALLQQPGKKQ